MKYYLVLFLAKLSVLVEKSKKEPILASWNVEFFFNEHFEY